MYFLSVPEHVITSCYFWPPLPRWKSVELSNLNHLPTYHLKHFPSEGHEIAGVNHILDVRHGTSWTGQQSITALIHTYINSYGSI